MLTNIFQTNLIQRNHWSDDINMLETTITLKAVESRGDNTALPEAKKTESNCDC